MGSTEELPLLQLPDRVLLLITGLLAPQDKLSLRALARTNSKLQQLALPALSASIRSTLANKSQLKSLQRYLQAHGSLTSRLSLQVGGLRGSACRQGGCCQHFCTEAAAVTTGRHRAILEGLLPCAPLPLLHPNL